ncbi:hypothetical protein B0H13DRAFT_1650609 [Mycena leptocephala]|nr:hypothetical protein B0H13DRAFT_1650609 [Mycena leptocephala]
MSKVKDLWWAKEESRRFQGPARGHTTGRPKQVANWIQYVRKGPAKPEITDAHAFGEQWWGWWMRMNPEWRGTTDTGRPQKIQVGEEWDELDYSGPNGVLNAIICLRWWRDAIGEGNEEGWKEAAEEVSWVMETMA